MQVICHQTMQDYPFGICGQEKVLNIIFVSQVVNIDSTILSWGKISFFFFSFLFFDTKELGKNWHTSQNNLHDFAGFSFSMKRFAWIWPHIFSLKCHTTRYSLNSIIWFIQINAWLMVKYFIPAANFDIQQVVQ